MNINSSTKSKAASIHAQEAELVANQQSLQWRLKDWWELKLVLTE